MLVMLSTGLNCRPERLRLAIHYRVVNARASLKLRSSQIKLIKYCNAPPCVCIVNENINKAEKSEFK